MIPGESAIPVICLVESAPITMVRLESAPAVATVFPAGIVVAILVAPPLVMLPLPESWITMIAVAAISHLIVMIFPVDMSIRFILHLIQTGPFPMV